MKWNTPVMEVLVGSHAYGTALPTSDRDEMRVHFAPVDHYLGLDGAKSSQKIVDGEDVQDYEFRHFVKLCLQFNPNVVTALWVKPHCYLSLSSVGIELLNRREMFSSQHCYATFRGYAQGQRMRMLGQTTGQLGEKRKYLVDQFGYDTKYAYHAVRLLRMCSEFLETETLNVFRKDGAELYQIRNGEYNLEQVEEIIRAEDERCKEAREKTALPKEPDYEAINRFVRQAVYEHVSASMSSTKNWEFKTAQ